MSTTALEQALYYFERRDNLDRDQKIEAAIALGEWGLFSARQIALALDMSHPEVAKLVKKSDRTGGRFRPEALRPLLKLARLTARGEVDVALVKLVLDAGVSKYFASKFTGLSPSTIERRYRKAEKRGARHA